MNLEWRTIELQTQHFNKVEIKLFYFNRTLELIVQYQVCFCVLPKKPQKVNTDNVLDVICFNDLSKQQE